MAIKRFIDSTLCSYDSEERPFNSTFEVMKRRLHCQKCRTIIETFQIVRNSAVVDLCFHLVFERMDVWLHEVVKNF